MTVPDQTKVSRDLAEILDLEQALLGQAVTSARAQLDGRSLPGGLAMVSLAPVARLVKWTDQILEAERTWREDNPGAPVAERPEWGADEDDSWEPALQTLRFWSDHYRRVLGMQYDLIPTLGTEAKFLRHETVLPWIFAREPHLAQFTADINQARRRLEDVVHAGRRPERTRVVCDHCTKAPQLVKAYSPRKVAGYACSACGTELGMSEPDHCPDPWCWSVAPAVVSQWSSDPADDRWKCPACKHRYDGDALRRAHAKQLRHESAEKFVAWDEARATLVSQGRSDRTVRKWMATQVSEVDACTVCRHHWEPGEYPVCPRRLKLRGEYTGETCGGELVRRWVGDREAVVEAYCELRTHRVMVWWPDLWRLHLSTQSRRRMTA